MEGGSSERGAGKGLLVGQQLHDAEVGYKVAAGLFKRKVPVAGALTSAHTTCIQPLLGITCEQMDAV